jgi:hypothetical protein
VATSHANNFLGGELLETTCQCVARGAILSSGWHFELMPMHILKTMSQRWAIDFIEEVAVMP